MENELRNVKNGVITNKIVGAIIIRPIFCISLYHKIKGAVIMKFSGPVIIVDNISASRKFYEELLSQTVILDLGANIAFDGGFSLLTKEIWLQFTHKNDNEIIFKSNNYELYFEEENFDEFISRLGAYGHIELVHDVVEYPWGQKVIRFYDVDKHIIEVGQSMSSVFKRFFAEGMTIEQIVERTEHPIEFVKASLE